MKFEIDHIYHVYNQGNNRMPIFYSRENYQYFVQKIKSHILPYVHILAWCLMPNHFHLLILVKETPGNRDSLAADISKEESDRVTPSHPVTNPAKANIDPLINSIAIMLRSYTRAINKQEDRSGSLFREDTKAIDFGSLASRLNMLRNQATNETLTLVNTEDDLSNCFLYINNNPVKAGLVKNITDWEFSSSREIAYQSDVSLTDLLLVQKLHLDF